MQIDAGQPRISFLMPVFNTPEDVLEDAIRSVLLQSSRHWELCICDDASTEPGVRELLDEYRGTDPRIRILSSPTNLHIARATNAAAEFATGEFVAFLDHDDVLAPDAVASILEAIQSVPDADVIYSDEDKIEPSGAFSESYFKPDWSPEHLMSVMYVLHLLVVRKSLFFSIGGLRAQFTGAQDYDLALRSTAVARRVVHVPRVLYHWRKIPGSAAAEVDAKPQALLNAEAALRDFVVSQNSLAVVKQGLFHGSFQVVWPVAKQRRVTLLIPTNCSQKEVPGRGSILLVKHAIESILAKSTWKNFCILVVDNGNMPKTFLSELQRAGIDVSSYSFDPPFNFAKKMNFAFSLVQTEDLIILNDDIEVIAPDWMQAMLGLTGRTEIGAVGARLIYPNNRVQHQGVVLGVLGLSTHIFHNLPREVVGYNGYTHVIRNYSAVTGAVLATRMSVVREVGGFDERLAVDYNDIDFCVRIGAAGYRIVYTPYAELYHFEGSTLSRSAVNPADEAAFKARWGDVINNDPYYNPNLPRDRGDCVIDKW